MEVSFLDLREKEIVNVYSGSRLGKILDLVFDLASGEVLGVVVPGDRKLFKRGDDIFVPLDKIKRVGEDVILVGIQEEGGVIDRRSKTERRRGNIETYYENGYFDTKRNGMAKQRRYGSERLLTAKRSGGGLQQNFERENAFDRDTEGELTELKPAAAVYNQNQRVKGQSKSISSYVRLRPLESKKYK